MKKYVTLVNKQNKLKQSYSRNLKLVPVKDYDGKDDFLEEETYKAYKQLKEFLYKKGIIIDLDGAYRSVEYQKEVYERFQEKLGQEDVSYRVAPPGTSEHHTGLAFDITLKIDGKYDEEEEEVATHLPIYQEIASHLSKFGFILRYPKGKEEITGYQ